MSSSYRSISKQPIAPSRRRSSSGVRSSTTNGSASAYNRSPRNINSYTGSVTSPYGSSLTGSSGGYYPNTYRSSQAGTYSASLSIPAKSLVSGLNTNSSSYARKYDSGRYSSTTAGGSSERRSRDLGRSGSYRMTTADGVKSSHSRSRSTGPVGNGTMGSRSTSLTSLNSEGYVVRCET